MIYGGGRGVRPCTVSNIYVSFYAVLLHVVRVAEVAWFIAGGHALVSVKSLSRLVCGIV